MKKLNLFLLFLTSLMILTPQNNKEEKINIENKIFNLKSSSFQEGYEENKSNDNDYSTYWKSQNLTNQTLSIDLLEIKELVSVNQIFNDEDIWYFVIEGSLDNINYFQLKDASYGEFGQTFVEDIHGYARYVRLTIYKSEKGFYPTSREFFVETKSLSEGTNLALSMDGNCSSKSGYYDVNKAFDGDYGTYYCASNNSYPQWISIEWPYKNYIKNINLAFQDYGKYTFEVEGRTIDGNFIKLQKETTINGSYYSFEVNQIIDAIVYRVFSGPGWANLVEMEVNGFKNLFSLDKIKNNILDLGALSYISKTNQDELEFSKDGTHFEKLLNDNCYRYVRNYNKETEIYGNNLNYSLARDFSGKVSSLLDEEHHLLNATKNPIINKNTFFQSEEKGNEQFLEIDLGRVCQIDKIIQQFNTNENWKFKLLLSKDGINYDEIASYYLEGLNNDYFEININQNNCLYRYVKLMVNLSSNQYLTSKRFEVIGNGASVKENWWQRESGVIRFYPKLQQVTLKEITSRLDEFKYSGYKVIELHQPYEGLADIWAGLGGTNNYQVDPLIGNIDDLKYLLHEAHKKGLYIFMFGNVGYGKYNADYFIKACKDYALGIASKERNWFVFSDTCLDPTKWFWSDVANAYYYGYWGENGKIPTFNFDNEDWQKETKKYIDFWARFGFDGIALDAPDVYYWGKTNASKVTYNVITNTMRKNNLFSLPEGSGDSKFISSYKYSAVQNYNMSSWGGGAESLGLNSARNKSAKNIDDNIKPFRDTSVSLGGVSIDGMNFEDKYLSDSMNNRILEAALVTSTGHLSFLHLGSSQRIGQDIMQEWDELTQNKIHRLFAEQNSISSLNPTGARHKLITNNETSFYTFIKTSMSGRSVVLPVFNYSSEKQIQINIANTLITKVNKIYDAYNDEEVEFKLNKGILTLNMKSSSYRLLIVR